MLLKEDMQKNTIGRQVRKTLFEDRDTICRQQDTIGRPRKTKFEDSKT